MQNKNITNFIAFGCKQVILMSMQEADLIKIQHTSQSCDKTYL